MQWMPVYNYISIYLYHIPWEVKKIPQYTSVRDTHSSIKITPTALKFSWKDVAF